MAKFACLKKLIAGNFDSESATDGQVLTADGAGNSAWEDAAGGASFGWAVTVNSDWAISLNAWTDISSATGMAAPTAHTLWVTLWEGSSDHDDYAELIYVSSGPVVGWITEAGGGSAAFSSPPTSGTAYIIGINARLTGGD